MSRPLDHYAPYLIAANVRPRFDPGGLSVGEGTGLPGDLVLGEVCPRDGDSITVLDQQLGPHVVESPTRVVAPLGTRESSTHVNGGIPEGGLDVSFGRDAHWLAGESGLVGLLMAEGQPASGRGIETSVPFHCIGLLQHVGRRNANIDDWAIRPDTGRLSVPMLAVGATSAEAGKTVLTQKVIRTLVDRGLRTAAIKVTGTGGTVDSSLHREAGAHVVLDQVDGGLITTYGDAGVFRERIVRPFRYAQDLGAEVIVAELGGDLVWANNPTFLAMPEMVDRMITLMVVNNDALSCLGIVRYLDERLRFPMDRVCLFSSPFRNHTGQLKRMPALGIGRLYDPNDRGQVEDIVNGVLPAAQLDGTRSNT
jgi:hypothetical protein